jgi:sulfur-carrier protein
VETVRVRYWAAARAAAGRDGDDVSGGTLADVLAEVRRQHADNARFLRVVDVCSVLVGEQPVGSQDPASVRVAPGETVELLPPFAGG